MAGTQNKNADRRSVTSFKFWQTIFETYLTRIVLTGLGLATTIVVSRALGPSGRGLFAVATAVAAIGAQFANLGLYASNTYYVAKDYSLLPVLVGNSLVVSLGIGGAAALVGCVADKTWPQLLPIHGTLLLLALGCIPFDLASLLLRHLLLGINQVRAYNGTELATRILGLVFLGIAIVFGQIKPEVLFGATMGGLMLSSCGALFRLLGLLHSPVFCSLSVFKRHVELGVKAYIVAFFGFLVLRIDLVMVKYLLGAEAAGYYSISEVMAENMMVPAVVVGTILFAKLSGMTDSKDKLYLTRKAALVTAAFMAPLMIIVAMLATVIIQLAFGKSFLPAVRPFIWLMPGTFFLGIETVIVQYLNSLGFPRVIAYCWLLVTVLNVGINLWAIPAYGITGAAIVSTVSYSLVFVLVLAMVCSRNLSDRIAVSEKALQYTV
jgi:O-antigen/teichoic acid export membrane protein